MATVNKHQAVPAPSGQAISHELPELLRRQCVSSAMPPLVALVACSDDVVCRILSAIATRHQVLGCGTQLHGLSQTEAMSAGESLGVALPHRLVAVKTEAVLEMKGAGAQ
jgi:hypothetical protein